VVLVLVRDTSATGYGPALVTTDTEAGPTAVIKRYAARRTVEAAIEDAKQAFGCGQARNRVVRAVERTVPLHLACQAIATGLARRRRPRRRQSAATGNRLGTDPQLVRHLHRLDSMTEHLRGLQPHLPATPKSPSTLSAESAWHCPAIPTHGAQPTLDSGCARSPAVWARPAGV